jgi:hypothetical protein
MAVALILSCILSLCLGALIFVAAKSAPQEAIGGTFLMISAIFFSALAVVIELQGIKKLLNKPPAQ